MSSLMRMLRLCANFAKPEQPGPTSSNTNPACMPPLATKHDPGGQALGTTSWVQHDHGKDGFDSLPTRLLRTSRPEHIAAELHCQLALHYEISEACVGETRAGTNTPCVEESAGDRLLHPQLLLDRLAGTANFVTDDSLTSLFAKPAHFSLDRICRCNRQRQRLRRSRPGVWASESANWPIASWCSSSGLTHPIP